MQIRTRPTNIRPVSSMRAALNSPYCMRAQAFKVRNLSNGQSNGQPNGELFFYQEGQHRVASHKRKQETKLNDKLPLPEEVKIERTKNGKRWSTSSMEVELAKDILEVRDGWGKIVDTLYL